jgi:hypothetical protein
MLPAAIATWKLHLRKYKKGDGMKRALIAASLVVAVPAFADDAPFQKPTALELFQLRGMCQKLGEEYDYPGKGATPEVKWMAGGMRDRGPEIHYNTKDGHCYLMAIFSPDGDHAACGSRYLYDVQSGALVANFEYKFGCPDNLSRRTDRDWGSVWIGGACNKADCASDFIDSKMKE